MLGWQESCQDTLGKIMTSVYFLGFKYALNLYLNLIYIPVTSLAVDSWTTNRLWRAVETWPVLCGMLKQVCVCTYFPNIFRTEQTEIDRFVFTYFLNIAEQNRKKTEIDQNQKFFNSPSSISHLKVGV